MAHAAYYQSDYLNKKAVCLNFGIIGRGLEVDWASHSAAILVLTSCIGYYFEGG
jgi:hypothetical protein